MAETHVPESQSHIDYISRLFEHVDFVATHTPPNTGQSYATCVTVTSQCSSPRVVTASVIATWGVPPILTRRQGSDGSRDTCAVVPTSRRETSPANAPTDPLLSAIGWRFCSGPFEGIYRIPNSRTPILLASTTTIFSNIHDILSSVISQ